MPRSRAVRAALVVMVILPGMPRRGAGQEWNDARTIALVSQATERRARQLADTGLADYTATAVGSLTFLAQVGEGFPDPPKVVKADQVALEVYWRAPNHSKQWILGRRDTLLLPTDIQYHRDHLGIVQNNFPEIIRLGDGDEVRDVPHPLSVAGMRVYDYQVADSLRIEVPGQVIEVYEVRVRPRDPTKPAAVGAVYLARSDAQVVRMAFSFTRAALIDRQLEDVSIVLDNALIEQRFWLPRRQEIEIRRTGTWLEFPARGIIRGGFEVCCYRINTGAPGVRFTGPEIELAPPERRAGFTFGAPLASVVPPDLATVSGEDVARVQARARELVAEAALARARRGTVLAGSVSSLARVTRAEGLSLGGGARWRLGGGVDAAVTGRYAMAKEAVQGTAALSWAPMVSLALRAGVFDEVRDASDVAEASGLRNSLGAQEFGADFTEPWRARGYELRLEQRLGARRPLVSVLSVGREWIGSAPVTATSAHGSYRPPLAVPSLATWRAGGSMSMTPREVGGGGLSATGTWQVRWWTEDGSRRTSPRATLHVAWDRRVGETHVVTEAFAGLATSRLPMDQLRAGGPVSGPGYDAHQFVSRALAWHRVEWRTPVPFPSIPLGRWGRTPARATFAPLAAVVMQEERDPAGRSSLAVNPALGAGLFVFFDLVRLDVARGLRNGRWTFGIDLTRDLWRIL